MKHILAFTTALMVLAIGAKAQDRQSASALVEALLDNCISLDYSWSSGKVTGNGKVTIQDNCFHATGNGLETFCDGRTRWTVDTEAREVCIEDCYGINEYVSMLSSVSDFKPSGNSYEGRMDHEGQTVLFKLSSIRKKEKTEDLSAFRFDVTGLDKSWVITDLR